MREGSGKSNVVDAIASSAAGQARARGLGERRLDIQAVGEIKILARLLRRSAQNSNHENLLNYCKSIADEIEYILDNAPMIPSISEIRDIFSINEKGSSLIFLKLLENPGRKYSYDVLSEELGYSSGSCTVFVSNLRKDLRALDLHDTITTCRLFGIYMSEANADRVMRAFYRLNHWDLGHVGAGHH